MKLAHLNVEFVRNLKHISISLVPRFNIFYGANASGKTSLLESVALLSLGRSFRSTQISRVISYDESKLTVFAKVQSNQQTIAVGIEKNRQGQTKIRVDGHSERSISNLVRIAPMQLIDPEAHQLIIGDAGIRRKFIDWGVFHVEHEFLKTWRNFKRASRQRNAVLKSASSDCALIWQNSFVEFAEGVAQYRLHYLDLLIPLMLEICNDLLKIDKLQISCFPGWDTTKSLQQVLKDSLSQDMAQGYTRWGPHRADLRIKVNGILAKHQLSRGQQKILVASMLLAQVELFHRQTQRKCVLLIDDLSSELDLFNSQGLLNRIDQLDCQVLITTIDEKKILKYLSKFNPALFHVEHGKISRML